MSVDVSLRSEKRISVQYIVMPERSMISLAGKESEFYLSMYLHQSAFFNVNFSSTSSNL